MLKIAGDAQEGNTATPACTQTPSHQPESPSDTGRDQPCPLWQMEMGFKTQTCIQSPGKPALILLDGSATNF